MHLDRVIVRIYIRSDGICKILDDSNTLTCHYAITNNSPRYLLHGPVTCNPARLMGTLRLRLFIQLRLSSRAYLL